MVTGDMVSPDRVGTFTGPVYGVTALDGGNNTTWIASGVGIYDLATPTVYGGHGWSYSIQRPTESSNAENGEGTFGFTKGSNGTLDLLAIGEGTYRSFQDIAHQGSGLLTASISSGSVTISSDQPRSINGYVSGLARSSDASGLMAALDGHVVSIYTDLDADKNLVAGIVEGEIAGKSYDIYQDPGTGDIVTLFRLKSVQGLSQQSKPLPDGFVPTLFGQYIGSDGYAAGRFYRFFGP